MSSIVSEEVFIVNAFLLHLNHLVFSDSVCRRGAVRRAAGSRLP